MQRTRPPFRADHVGSLLRTEPLKAAREKWRNGAIDAAALKAVEDREIEKIVRKQEAIGLQLATDGEFRRAWWMFDFFEGLDGMEVRTADTGIAFHGVATAARMIHTDSRVGYSGHYMVDHFRFLKDHTKVTPKMTVPAPGVRHFRPGRPSVSREVYPDLDQFFDDLAAAYKAAVADFYAAGCRYLQLDDTTWAMLCSDAERQHARERGDDPDRLPERYGRMINQALADKPADLTVTMHSCRGNFRSSWIAEGGYEPVAERMFNDVDVDGYFLEYDTDRAGGFEPLRFFPKGDKQLVLGLVSSKVGALESKDDIKRRIDEASHYVPLDQLCLSPQCGFASTEEGNLLSEDEQWAKLVMIVEVSHEVWGK